ncbi:bacteriocin biosynthesis cyclodehydratase domain-containing protein [Micromonospora sp. A202]|uniref:TOMM precursor leader peptide-binding protein n=1 Tax=Micromonospora sp. A202 TaxID=2572899 RepID=UPI0011519BC2|nr:TOMM precursor leader peptide-binding protein [Micromonospora sp. A202]TQJ24941.1 bacteriocin biosynthesis cyclodehydratase domain-containing protein [Micromonospora sp. A202]
MSRTVLPRPTLLPGLNRLWRDRHTLQLGVGPGPAVLLELANPRAAHLLDLLDGTRSERSVLTQAATVRVTADEARALLDALRTAGLLVPAHSLLPRDLAGPVRARLAAEAGALALAAARLPGTPAQILRRRRTTRVVLTGAGALGGPLTVALAQAGVGQVIPHLTGPVRPVDLVGTGIPATELGHPLAPAVRAAVNRVAPGTGTQRGRSTRVDLVIQLGTDRPPALVAAGLAQRRQPHLLVTLREGVPVVGPLVRPPAGPCLHCVELHRADRDPDWPRLAAQLAATDPVAAGATSTLLAAIGYALAEALTQLDGGQPETLGGAMEITDAGRFRRRGWPPHPACGCSRGRVSAPARPQSSSGALRSVTMTV